MNLNELVNRIKTENPQVYDIVLGDAVDYALLPNGKQVFAQIILVDENKAMRVRNVAFYVKDYGMDTEEAFINDSSVFVKDIISEVKNSDAFANLGLKGATFSLKQDGTVEVNGYVEDTETGKMVSKRYLFVYDEANGWVAKEIA